MPRIVRLFIPWILCLLIPTLFSGTLGAVQLSSSVGLTQHHSPPFAQLISTKKSSRRQTGNAQPPSLVQNLRFHRYADHTRLVIDVEGQLHLRKRSQTKTDQVILELANTRLSKRAFGKTRNTGFPQSVQIARKWGNPVTITIDLSAINTYKVITLNNPTRLVLDLFPSTEPKMNGDDKPSLVQKIPEKSENATPRAARKNPPSTAKPVPVQSVKPAKSSQRLLIVLDPGHGGKDPGALGRKGTREKDIVLKVSKQLKQMITERLNAKVLMTREDDVFIELEDRAKFANSEKADLFVSIHINSHPKHSVKGLELYHFGQASDPRALEVAARENGTPLENNGPAWQFILADKLTDKKIDESRDLAWIARKALVGHLRKHYKIKDHGVKTAPFFVLRNTTMPGILAEIAFVSNPIEEKLLRSTTYQTRVAEGIYQGIKAYVAPLQTVLR
ncbi:MAG: N-acetylmuramoyl-L-alanine amidase [Nitrospirales bacterium]|nr:N-acetylmuramoyl-L-alanine amidase [Nitrospira sp.]MDR4499908.1 N-acetylmuramoyl-L-alanine amidase [Nitrospirales bacterium]